MSPIQKAVFNGVKVDFVDPPNVDPRYPKILFVHGMWGAPWIFYVWLSICYLLKIRAYALDLEPADGRSTRDYVDMVVKVLDQIGPAALIGHSNGAIIASVAASENPNKALALVRVAGSLPKGMRCIELFWFKYRYWRAITSGKQFRLTDRDAMKHVLNRIPEQRAWSLLKHFRTESGLVLKEAMLGVEVGPISCPVLVIGGIHDKILRVKYQRLLYQQYRRRLNAKYMDFPMGHMVPIEDADGRELRKILIFLNQNVPQAVEGSLATV